MSAPERKTADMRAAAFRGGQLVLRSLTKRYPGLLAVDAIDLEVRSGEFLTLLGPSGSGKTTTLMMIAGFTEPSDGDILLDGRSIAGLPPERRNIGVVFQNYALFPHMTVFENVAFPLKMRRESRQSIAEKVKIALGLVQLSALEARYPSQLSGGQQQRVALARALVFNPGILLMDEPLGALDKQLREQMQFELKRLHRELGVTIVYVTHDQEEALTMSDRVAVMSGGRIEQLDRPDEIYERPNSRFVAEFIGESNLIEGTLEESGDAAWFIAANGMRIEVSDPRPKLVPGRSCLLLLRPEKAVLSAAGADGYVVGTVAEFVYVGDFSRYRIDVHGMPLTVKVQNSRRSLSAEVGSTVGVRWDPSDACIICDPRL